MPWGDRSCRLRDPFGNLWWVMTHVEDLTPEEECRRWGDPVYLAALQEHESAEFFPRPTGRA
jgi:PhnB protein